MTVFRLFAGILLLIAVIALVSDYTAADSAGQAFSATPFAHHWGDISPSSIQAARNGVTKLAGPWAWDVVIANIIALPTFVLFAITGLACAYIGRRRKRINIYAN